MLLRLISCLLVQVVSQEESAASAEAAKVQAIKDECEADLAEAMPALQAAIKALDTLTKNDITEVKGMKSPPNGELKTQHILATAHNTLQGILQS